MTDPGAAWHRWLFDRIVDRAPATAVVLHVDAADGRLWADNHDRLPRGWRLILLDPSPGVAGPVGAAWSVAAARAAALPLADSSVDLVVASRPLDADPGRSVAELARVLRPGAVCVTAVTGPAHSRASGFDLVTAAPLLSRHFARLHAERFRPDPVGGDDVGLFLSTAATKESS